MTGIRILNLPLSVSSMFVRAHISISIFWLKLRISIHINLWTLPYFSIQVIRFRAFRLEINIMSSLPAFSEYSGKRLEKASFSLKCSLLSQYLKEKGSFGGLNLGMSCNVEGNDGVFTSPLSLSVLIVFFFFFILLQSSPSCFLPMWFSKKTQSLDPLKVSLSLVCV